MAVANIRAVITAQDNASRVVSQFGDNVSKANGRVTDSNNKTNDSFNKIIASTLVMGSVSHKLLGVIDDSVTSANKYQNALLGLTSISKAYGQSADEAKKAAASLASDGLLTVTDAARGLKNLLASGFSLDQAIKLMQRFKDSAAFGRQSALSFGDAVASATEGIKNGNSILVDNAGVTKNLSVILEEAGFSAQDLMRATTDATVRQALFNGIIKETNANVGDAAKLATTFAGGQAKLTARTTELKQQIGEALQPALTRLLEVVTPVIEKFAKFTEDHPKLVAATLLITAAVTGLIAVLGALGLAIMGLTPLIGVMTGAVGLATGAFGAMTGAVGTAVGALSTLSAVSVAGWAALVVADLYLVKKAADAVTGAFDAMNQAKISQANLESSNKIVRANLEKLAREGTPDQRARAKQQLAAGVGLASGTDYWRGGSVVVGEQGREIVNLPRGSEVVPSHKVDNAMGGGQPINITIQAGAYMGNQQDARKYAKMIVDAYKDVQSMRGQNGVFA